MNQLHENVYIPEGITFGDKVVVVPSVLGSFSHAGHMEARGDLHKSYAWIDRGSDLGRYTIEIDKIHAPILGFLAGTETKKASIPSPVSGLLVHRTYDFDLNLTAILLPVDEPKAENGEYMFRALCDLCTDHMRYFLMPSRYWTSKAWSEKIFNDVIAMQLSKECQYVDAMPKYKDYFDEARTRHPNLRPLIRHLG